MISPYICANIRKMKKYFSSSIIFLSLIFGLSWWYALKIHKVDIPIRLGISSHGFPIFAKYIPGKIWTILGRASQVADKTEKTTSSLSFISLKEQLVYLLVGILISIYPIYMVYGANLFLVFVGLSGLGLFLIIFNKSIHDLLLFVLNKFLKKKPDLPLISLKNGFKLSWFNLLLWLMWTLGFYFFAKSVSLAFSFDMAFVFPISVVYGVLAIVMPGGIGVREGIITAYLSLSGMDLEIASSISIASRLWFILGEVFL
ncbi:MAG: hypothetical protein B7C24_17070 [Bacteroidetes bacterium 4572_77]|nr:MAG: hypothetical protein B7C24_17070 [Bacteroidetes bacterium 4572_77]